jgi:hypothetical protein
MPSIRVLTPLLVVLVAVVLDGAAAAEDGDVTAALSGAAEAGAADAAPASAA